MKTLLSQTISKETMEAPSATPSNIIEHKGNLFVAYGNKMFQKKPDSEKWEQMVFVTIEPDPDAGTPERAYRETMAMMNRYLNLSPDHPHTLGACFEVARRQPGNRQMMADKFAESLAIILDNVFSEVK